MSCSYIYIYNIQNIQRYIYIYAGLFIYSLTCLYVVDSCLCLLIYVFASFFMFKPPPDLVTSIDSTSMPVISERVKRLAEESYNFMIDNDRLGYACIVEKCYLIAGIQHEHLHLLFRGLKQIIDVESEVSVNDYFLFLFFYLI